MQSRLSCFTLCKAGNLMRAGWTESLYLPRTAWRHLGILQERSVMCRKPRRALAAPWEHLCRPAPPAAPCQLRSLQRAHSFHFFSPCIIQQRFHFKCCYFLTQMREILTGQTLLLLSPSFSQHDCHWGIYSPSCAWVI